MSQVCSGHHLVKYFSHLGSIKMSESDWIDVSGDQQVATLLQ